MTGRRRSRVNRMSICVATKEKRLPRAVCGGDASVEIVDVAGLVFEAVVGTATVTDVVEELGADTGWDCSPHIFD